MVAKLVWRVNNTGSVLQSSKRIAKDGEIRFVGVVSVGMR